MYNNIMRSINVNISKEKALSKVIFEKYPSLSKNVFFKALRNKDIKVNSKRISKDIMLKSGDILDIYISDEYLFNLPHKINIIYEDDNVLFVFKPQGLLSNNEDNKNTSENIEPTLEDLVKKIYKDSFICHRLDRNTAGIVIFCKKYSLYDVMFEAFKNSNINKEYLACVDGILEKKKDILNQYIITDRKNGFSKICSSNIKGSMKAITEYSVIKENKEKNYSILNVKILTGKTHQIRACFSSISHPIIGDSKYGRNEINKKFKKYKQLLLAYKYSFNFDNTSPLSYLNNKTISLNKNYIDNFFNI